MSLLYSAWSRIRSLARTHTLEQGLEDEIRFHIDQQTRKNLDAGMSADEARRDALVRFGGIEQTKDATRDELRFVLVHDVLRDLRHGTRALRRAPAFTLLAVLTLGLGIGATTSVFSVVRAVLIEPLPFPDAGELVSIKHTSLDQNGGPNFGLSASLLLTYAKENRAFESIGGWFRGTENVTGDGLPEEVTSLNVSAGTLPTLGVPPAMGRWFSSDDEMPGSAETVMLTHGYWERRFGGGRSVVGRVVVVNARPRTIIGVMPASFRFLDENPDLIMPVRFTRDTLTLGGFYFDGIARLRPGETAERAASDVARMIPIWIDAWPSFRGIPRSAFADAKMTPVIRPLKQELIGDVRTMLWIVMGTIAVVLIIACANVATLMLVRAEGRDSEFALRTALGASRGRLAREMILESLVLGAASGTVGLGLALAAMRLLAVSSPDAIPRLHEVTLTPSVVVFALAVSVLSVVFVGVLPVIRHTGQHVTFALRAGGRSGGNTRERLRVRNGLVIVQVALALILLVGSGLMIRTFLALRAVQPGFVDPRHIQLARVTIPDALVGDDARVVLMQREMRDRLAAIPGVRDVSFTANVPMAGERTRSSIYRDDEGIDEIQHPPPLRWFRFIAPNYFHTVGTPLIAGRDISWTDIDDNRPVAVVSENLARELWHEPAAALGRRIREGAASPWREVIGVVGDVQDNGLNEAPPSIVYWPWALSQFYGGGSYVRRAVTFALRTDRAGTPQLLADVGKAIGSVSHDVPLTRVRTLGDVYDHSLAATSFTLIALGAAAAAALFLGLVGIYGVVAYTVTQRRREIGIRVALGAPSGDVRRLFMRQGATLATVGVICGLAGAALLTRLMAKMLFGTSPLDPVTYGSVALGLVGIATFASYVPARRAASVDPIQSLRGE